MNKKQWRQEYREFRKADRLWNFLIRKNREIGMRAVPSWVSTAPRPLPDGDCFTRMSGDELRWPIRASSMKNCHAIRMRHLQKRARLPR